MSEWLWGLWGPPLLYAAAGLGFGCGVLVAALLRVGRDADDRWQGRRWREWDESRWREGSALDGAWRAGRGRRG